MERKRNGNGTETVLTVERHGTETERKLFLAPTVEVDPLLFTSAQMLQPRFFLHRP